MSLIGKQIAHYLIEEKIGEGGMGIVYKAEDTKLKRKVALKFLKPEALGNEQEKARFLREAQTAAALDHPNICTIFETNEFEGHTYIAMAFIDGQNIDEKMEAGPLSIDEAVTIAKQVAEGLQAAHEKGIVHRDIKSANIMVTAKGQVKIMDFGLAKLAGQAKKITRSGMTPGTVAYMSPEQARGEEVDHRSDIWSLGVVLYEMITGQLPFKGEYERAMLYSIMSEEPEPLAHYNAGVSEGIQQIVDKSLDKDREMRYQHIADILADLKQIRKSSADLVKPIRIKRRLSKQNKLMLAAFAMILPMVVFLSYYIFKWRPSERMVSTHKQVTFTGNASYPAISPDGQFVAYVIESAKAGQKVMVQDLSGGQPIDVYQANSCEYLRWSPDGSELICTSDSENQVVLLPRLGGNSHKIIAWAFPSWSPDGSHIASAAIGSKFILITNKTTGEQARLHINGDFYYLKGIDWSPSGNRIMYLTYDTKRFMISTIKIDGSDQQKVVEDSLELSSPRWSADGKAIYYLRTEGQTKNLMRIRINSASGKASGSPSPLLVGLPFGDYFTLTRDNKRLFYTREILSKNLWLITLKGEDKQYTFETKQLTTGTSWIHAPSISPDGRRVAFSIGKPFQANLFIMPIVGGSMQQLTFLDSYNQGAAWSPDGNEIAFCSNQDGFPRVWRINSSGGQPIPFAKSETTPGGSPLNWSPGSNILYQRTGNQNFYFLDPETEEEKPLFEKPTGWVFRPRYSPDAKSVALFWNKPPESGLWLISFKDKVQTLLSRRSVFPIKWSSDGKWIYAYEIYKKNPEVLKIPIEGGQSQAVITLPIEDVDEPDVIDMSPDEKQSDVWLMENFDSEIK